MYSVKAPMIVVRVPGVQGGETYMRRGRFLPESVTSSEVDRLLELDLIEEAVDEVELIVAATAEAEQAAERDFEARVQEAAARLVAEELAPEFDLRVQEAAEKLDADRGAAASENVKSTEPAKPSAGKQPTK